MAADKRRKKKPVKKKPQQDQKKGLFGIGKNKPKDSKEAKGHQPEETVAGNGTVIQSKASLLGRITAYAVVAFLLLGSTLAIVNFLSPNAQIEQVADSGEDPIAHQAGDFARGYVGTWLRATRDETEELERYISAGRGDITDEEPTEFRDLAVASVETNEQGIVTVIISGEVLTVVDDEDDDQAASTEEEETTSDEEDDATEEDDADDAVSPNNTDSSSNGDSGAADEDEGPETRWVPAWYQTNIHHQEGTFTPLGWPAPVPAPQTGNTPNLEYRFAASEELEGTVQDFMEAYIQEGDVSRLTHPEATINPLGASPYDHVAVTDVSTEEDHREEVPDDGTTTRALITVELGASQEETRLATYALTLETRGGRWEVQTLDPAPVINPEQQEETEDQEDDFSNNETPGLDEPPAENSEEDQSTEDPDPDAENSDSE